MRNSLTQARLKHLAILYVNQELTDLMDLVAIAKEFVGSLTETHWDSDLN